MRYAQTWTRRDFCRAAAGLGVGAFLPLTACGGGQTSSSSGPAHLKVLTHWSDPAQMDAMKAVFGEYQKQNKGTTIDYETVSFDQLLPKITAYRAAGTMPDVVHMYTLWLPDFVAGGALDKPPSDVVSDVRGGFSPASVAAATYQGQVWGFPTELDIYQLIYNKKLLSDAGVSSPPSTWDALRTAARSATRRDASGKTISSGFTTMAGWDSGVVHPFVALLWSDGGQYISKNGTRAQFDDPKGLAVLNLYMNMIADKSIDLSLNMSDFVNGKSAMIIMANWWHTTMQKQFKDGFANVGVAPIPHGPGGQPMTLQYNWMWTVAKDTKNRDAAWKLASWLNQPGSHKASPTGTFLAEQLGAIPSRISDQQALTSKYFDDDFMKVFLAATKHAQPEPPVRGGQEVKTTLQQDIEAAWYGKKSPSDALADAAQKADQTLGQNR